MYLLFHLPTLMCYFLILLIQWYVWSTLEKWKPGNQKGAFVSLCWISSSSSRGSRSKHDDSGGSYRRAGREEAEDWRVMTAVTAMCFILYSVSSLEHQHPSSFESPDYCSSSLWLPVNFVFPLRPFETWNALLYRLMVRRMIQAIYS